MGVQHGHHPAAVNRQSVDADAADIARHIHLRAANRRHRRHLVGSEPAGSSALSAITSATAAHTFDNPSLAQTWTWNSLTTQTAFTLSSSSLTNGSILSIQNSAASATSTGKVLSISDATTGSGYGVYSSMTGHGNTGYAGYFVNTDTSNSLNYGIYGITLTTNTANAAGVGGECDAAGYQGVFGTSTNGAGVAAYGGFAGVYTLSSTSNGIGIYALQTGHGNTGYAGYFINTDTSATALNYGIYSAISSTSTTLNNAAIYGTAACGSCAGVAGVDVNNAGVAGNGSTGVFGSGTAFGGAFYSSNTATGYGVYGTITGANNTGYGGYFSNTSTTGWAGYFNGGKLQVTNPTAFNPTTMPIDSVVVGSASANGCAGDGVYMSDTTTVGDGQGFIAYLGGSTYIGQLQSGNCYLGITFSNSGYIGIWNGSPSATLDIGLNGTTTGTLRLEGKTSGYVQIQTANAAGNATFQLPSSNGTSGFVLSTDGTGVTSWISNAGTASTALSGITVASAAHTINNVNWAQTWNWNSLTTQTAMTFASSSLTTGNIVTIQNTAAAVTSTGKVLNISDATTGSGYGVYSSMTGHGNTGYAGYFINTDTSNNINYGVYGTANCTSGGSCAGVEGYSQNIGVEAVGGATGVYAYTSLGSTPSIGVWSTNAGVSNTGYAGYFVNEDTSTSSNYGLYASDASTGTGYGVYSSITGHGNTGYAGYFINTDTSTTTTNYGIAGKAGLNTTSTGSNSVGVYGEGDCWNCYGGYFTSTNGDGILAGGSYAGGYFVSNSYGTFGVYAQSQSTGTGYGVYGAITGAANTGYAGYFVNTSTGGYAGYFTDTATTGGPKPSRAYTNNYPAGEDKLDVGDVNESSSSIDQWGNTFFAQATYYFGHDNNYNLAALSSNNAPLCIPTDGANGANDNIYLEPNGSGAVAVNGTATINSGSTNYDTPLYINLKTSDATVAISRGNDTTSAT